MPDPQMRAADNDRAAVASRLGEHMAAGRLSLAEYEDRSARVYAAKTYGELAELTADLPSPAARATAPVARPQSQDRCGGAPWGAAGPWARGHMQGAWASWLTTALVVVSIWLITSIASGGLIYFWPIWVIGPWGAVLLAQSLSGGPPARRGRRRTRV